MMFQAFPCYACYFAVATFRASPGLQWSAARAARCSSYVEYRVQHRTAARLLLRTRDMIIHGPVWTLASPCLVLRRSPLAAHRGRARNRPAAGRARALPLYTSMYLSA